jgi:hypothetical protein
VLHGVALSVESGQMGRFEAETVAIKKIECEMKILGVRFRLIGKI